MSSKCDFFSMVTFKATTADTVVMARVRCKSWQCPHCAKENRKMWGNFLRKKLPRITSNWWFVTLTAHKSKRDVDTSLANLRTNIDRMFKRVRRIWHDIEYVRVYEVHKKGAFHAHLLVSGLSAFVQKLETQAGICYYRPAVRVGKVGYWSVKTWFKRTAYDLEIGYMVDVQALEGVSAAAGYIVKYLTKDAQNFHVKGLRRVQTTTGIGSPRNAGDGTWRCAARVFRQNVPEGARLYDADCKLWISPEYWRDNLTYPKPNS